MQHNKKSTILGSNFKKCEFLLNKKYDSYLNIFTEKCDMYV